MMWYFWMAFGFVIYTYAVYPICVFALSQLRKFECADSYALSEWPSVCILIAVHNEQARVLPKIENLRNLDYPKDRLRVVFVSDGSTDQTAQILASVTDVELLSYAERCGKAHALNVARACVREDVVVFADVRQVIVSGAIKALVSSLLRPGIGVVSGELVHVNPETQQAANIGLYWRYEKFIRKAESRLHSTAGATGALYAIRGTDMIPLAEDTILDDFETPSAILRKGLRTILESRAIVYDELQADTAGERHRKVRTLAGNFQSFARNTWLFLPWKNPIWWQFISHKVFRLFVPYALAVVLLSSLFLDGLYRAFGVMQLAGYAIAFVGMRWRRLREQKLIGVLVVFVELNLAAVVALRKYLTGELNARWEKT